MPGVRSFGSLLFALTFAVFTTISNAWATDWEFAWANPLPQGNRLGAAAFEDATSGWAVGDRGTLLRTTDGGGSWSAIELFPGFSADLRDFVLLGPGEMLAVGSSPGIFRSHDGGATWSPVPNPSTGTLEDVEVVSGTILSAAGSGGEVLRSNDNGDTWSLLPAAGADLDEQEWLSPTEGYVLGNMLVRRTTDGGATWQPLPGVSEGGERFNEIWFTDSQQGFMLSDFHLWKTSNRGASWTASTTPNAFVYCGSAVVLGPAHFVAVTNLEGASIWETTDSGANWNALFYSGAGGFSDLDLLSDGTLIAISTEGDVFRSTDSGANWVLRTGDEAGRMPIGAIGVAPGGTGGSAGTTGSPGLRWYHTTDNGNSWRSDPAGPGIDFTQDVEFWDADRGVVAGDYGRMWRTTDGGAHWNSVTLPGVPANGSAWTMDLAGPGIAFAGVTGQSNQGVVYRTTDFGASWQQRNAGIPAGTGMTGISFVSPSTGFVSGFNGGAPRVYKTTDGGGSWTLSGSSGLPAWTWDIHFLDAQTGLAAVYIAPGGIFRTTNAGASWTNVRPGPVHDLAFTDALHGCATEFGYPQPGKVLTTDDGGLTWTEVVLPSTEGGTCVAAAGSGFLVGGNHGTIVRMTPAGTSGLEGGLADGTSRGSVNGRAAVLSLRGTVGRNIAIEFTPRETGAADLGAFSVSGRRVATLHRGEVAAGTRVSATWDGTGDSGVRSPAGVYFICLTLRGEVLARKVTLTD